VLKNPFGHTVFDHSHAPLSLVKPRRSTGPVPGLEGGRDHI
jgi:hypothetical protein